MSKTSPYQRFPNRLSGPEAAGEPLGTGTFVSRSEAARFFELSERTVYRYPNPIERARCYEEIIRTTGASYAGVARQCGVTREEVCHYVTLVRRLPQEIISAVEAESDPRRLRVLCLRRLLMIARMPCVAGQRKAFAAIAGQVHTASAS